MKCHDCVCGIDLEEEGVWCIHYKCVPSEELVESCGAFLAKDAISRSPGSR